MSDGLSDAIDSAVASFNDDPDSFDATPTQLDRIEANTAETLATMHRIEELVTNTLSEVKPTLDNLMNHPMLKMLGMGGKK
jgi:hypothetical protein